MKILSVFVILLLSSLAFASQHKHLCQITNLLPPDDFDHSFICANSTDGFEIDVPIVLTIPAAESRSVFTVPEDEDLIVTFSATDLWGSHIEDAKTSFVFQISAGDAVGSAAECEISYDFDGDGDWDRTEIYDIFATNDIADEFESWESFNNSVNITGDFGNFIGGSIRVRVWAAFGDAALFLRIGVSNDSDSDSKVSWISFPFEFEQVCCGKIGLLRTELFDLMERVDMLHSRLLNLTANCCGNDTDDTEDTDIDIDITTSISTGGTVTSIATAPATVAETSVELSTATAIVSSSAIATDVATDIGTATVVATVGTGGDE